MGGFTVPLYGFLGHEHLPLDFLQELENQLHNRTNSEIVFVGISMLGAIIRSAFGWG